MDTHYSPFSCGLDPMVFERDPVWDPFTERHLHCIWFDDRLRPHPLKSTEGEEIRILHPGHWNHEKGPDFHQAEWEVEGRRYQGDVEIHIRPADWRAHGHSRDPAYGQVGLHVTYEPGELPEKELPPGCVQLSLKSYLEKRSHFFFDSIDPGAYPDRGAPRREGLHALLAGHPEEEQARLLEAAGAERLRRKAIRFQHRARAVGADQALYAGLMRGLGYKKNADVAERLSTCLPADLLRNLSGKEPLSAYALLLGVSGLLPDRGEPSGFPSWVRVRDVWDRWWPHQSRFLGRALQASEWRLDSCRPGNHPWRRLWAAAWWSCTFPSFPEALVKPPELSNSWIRKGRRQLQLSAPDHAEAIVGPQRAGTLFLNVVVPYWISMQDTPPGDDFWGNLPSEPLNALSKRTGRTLFGTDVHPRLYRGGLRRQGLLQFHEDFGL